MSPRKVAVVTTSRADYGLLSHLMRRLRDDRRFALQVLACGSHLSAKYGMTVGELERDGFRVSARVATLPRRDEPRYIAEALGAGMAGFARAYARLKPDLVVVLGDRQELLAAVPAAVLLRLPIAHIHGGESTEGVLDEQVRHAVTKMSHLHFAAAEPYRRRIIALGEDPRRVWCFGAPGLESIRLLKARPIDELRRRVGVPVDERLAVVTYHPDGTGVKGVRALLGALEDVGLNAVFTAANADAEGIAINAVLRRWCALRPGRASFVASLGHRDYLSLARLAGVVAGNSSSGIIEAPSLKVPTVNIGERQRGRLRSPSVIDCPPRRASVAAALRRTLSPTFRNARCRGVNVYGAGRFSERATEVLARVPLGAALVGAKTVRHLDRKGA